VNATVGLSQGFPRDFPGISRGFPSGFLEEIVQKTAATGARGLEPYNLCRLLNYRLNITQSVFCLSEIVWQYGIIFSCLMLLIVHNKPSFELQWIYLLFRSLNMRGSCNANISG